MANNTSVIEPLQNLFCSQQWSLEGYLTNSSLWSNNPDRQAVELLETFRNQQEQHIQQVAELIRQRGGVLPKGGYPDAFAIANFHYASLSYLLRELRGYQEQILSELSEWQKGCTDDNEAIGLFDQVIHTTKDHLTQTESLVSAASADLS